MSDSLQEGSAESSAVSPTAASNVTGVTGQADPVRVYDIRFDASTGDFVGFASMITKSWAVLHPSATSTVLARSSQSLLKFRLQIPVPHHLIVRDSTAIVGELDGLPAIALELDHPVDDAKAPYDNTYDVGPELGRYLSEQAKNAPRATTDAPPDRPHNAPGLLDWFCKAFPSASCC
jgi:hypothetical protein